MNKTRLPQVGDIWWTRSEHLAIVVSTDAPSCICHPLSVLVPENHGAIVAFTASGHFRSDYETHPDDLVALARAAEGESEAAKLWNAQAFLRDFLERRTTAILQGLDEALAAQRLT